MLTDRVVIGLLMATLLEAQPFVEKLALRLYEQKPFEIYGNEKFLLVISGIGKANAAAACVYLLMTKRISCVFNLGAAGALDDTHPMATVCHISKIIEPDRPCLKSGIPHEHQPDILEGFQTASLATQDKPVITAEDRKQIALKAEVADMEGASVVQTCRRFQTKCYVFKFVSDTPENHAIIKNIEYYREDFCSFFCESLCSTVHF
jgi:adenosylhomocysteine nucleosidase